MAKQGDSLQTGEAAEGVKSSSEADKAEAKNARRSLDQRIEVAAEALRRLQEQKRKAERVLREQNEKELRDIIKAEKLDDFGPETWRAALADIRAALTRAQKS